MRRRGVWGGRIFVWLDRSPFRLFVLCWWRFAVWMEKKGKMTCCLVLQRQRLVLVGFVVNPWLF